MKDFQIRRCWRILKWWDADLYRTHINIPKQLLIFYIIITAFLFIMDDGKTKSVLWQAMAITTCFIQLMVFLLRLSSLIDKSTGIEQAMLPASLKEKYAAIYIDATLTGLATAIVLIILTTIVLAVVTSDGMWLSWLVSTPIVTAIAELFTWLLMPIIMMEAYGKGHFYLHSPDFLKFIALMVALVVSILLPQPYKNWGLALVVVLAVILIILNVRKGFQRFCNFQAWSFEEKGGEE